MIYVPLMVESPRKLSIQIGGVGSFIHPHTPTVHGFVVCVLDDLNPVLMPICHVTTFLDQNTMVFFPHKLWIKPIITPNRNWSIMVKSLLNHG